MGDPVILPRAEHTISRQQIDSDALKVLYRLHQNGYTAYLVGGSVRDVLLGRRPKDFDIGTSAHPYQVKKLFRNCWIIGRRFRLAHVRFGTKNIEVATFRRHVTPEEIAAAEATAASEAAALVAASEADVPTVSGLPEVDDTAARYMPRTVKEPRAHAGTEIAEGHEKLIHRDNTFGTPEEDAFRRDFTINALFYNIADFSIIDYTGGLRDLEARVVRCIGDPDERFQEDPVRMTRAVAMAARLGFTIDPPIDAAIARNRELIASAAPARMVEEFFKLLRSGAGETAFRMMADRRLLEPMAPALQEGAGPVLWRSLAQVDAYRARFTEAPDTLTNAILLGSLLMPLGYTAKSFAPVMQPDGERKEPKIALGNLPLARRDIERLRQILQMQRSLTDVNLSPRARLGLMHRSSFRESLTWLEIHGGAPEIVEHWKGFIEAAGTDAVAPGDGSSAGGDDRPKRRRRRRRIRGPRKPGETA